MSKEGAGFKKPCPFFSLRKEEMMILHTDHYFSIGQAHLGQGSPCQDFALSDVHGDTAFAIVADGCSTGGLTDVGSRVIALSTAQAIRECVGNQPWDKTRRLIATQQQATMISSRRMLGLNQQDMLATCVYALLSPKGGFVHLQGDGVVAFKHRDGHIRMSRYDWANNMPAYLAYAEDNYAAFIAAQGGDVQAFNLSLEGWTYTSQHGIGREPFRDTFSIEKGVAGIAIAISQAWLENLEFIAVFTDGVTQIENQDWKQAVVDLLAFKNVAGEFAKRRMIRHIKDVQKSGKGPIDDIAYAVIRVQPEEVPSAAQP
ncbi:MAG: protein phosphatase 2C domain-containing protein [Pseudomonadota bacterium]|nr:protein phosphatase 2C domain-containing protein [Pseudomonadota bacterium]